MFSVQYLITFLLAIIPAAIWIAVFRKKYSVNPWSIFFTFVGGILAAQLILLYKGYWGTEINLIFLKVNVVDFRSNIDSLLVGPVSASLLIFLSIGIMEEVSKFVVMRLINKDHFKTIDDVITLAIVSALGFAFYENMVYFNAQWGVLDGATFVFFVLSRITVVTMVHMLCSGVLGYYFGLAHFASPVLRLQYQEKKRHPLLNFFKTILHMKRTHLYRDEMMMLGLFLAMALHGIYNFILSSTVSLSPIFITLSIMFYFVGGYLFLSYLLKKKEDKIELGLIVDKTD